MKSVINSTVIPLNWKRLLDSYVKKENAWIKLLLKELGRNMVKDRDTKEDKEAEKGKGRRFFQGKSKKTSARKVAKKGVAKRKGSKKTKAKELQRLKGQKPTKRKPAKKRKATTKKSVAKPKVTKVTKPKKKTPARKKRK